MLKRKSPDTDIVVDSIIDPAKLLKLKTGPVQETYKFPRKIQVPPSTVPSLSKSTCEIIESIRSLISNHSPDLSLYKKEDMPKISATNKYKHLLTNDKSLPLPSECQALVRLFRHLDSTIYYAHIKQSTTLFAHIQTSIEQTHGQNCKLPQVQKILFIHPGCYTLSWKLINKDYNLFIDFPSKVTKEDIVYRKTLFENKVMQMAKDFHQKFLDENGLIWENQEYWHPSFLINSFPPVLEAEISPKPVIAMGKIDKFLAEQFENNEKFKSNPEIIEVPEISEIKGLCPVVAAKIIAKEKLLNSKKAELVESIAVEEHNKGERLYKMIEILKVLFSTHKTPSMFFNILVNKLKQILNSKNTRVIEEDLMEIITSWPDFITLIQTNSGPVVRIQRKNELKLTDLKKELKNKFNCFFS
jgi:DNA replication factor CDT1 like